MHLIMFDGKTDFVFFVSTFASFLCHNEILREAFVRCHYPGSAVMARPAGDDGDEREGCNQNRSTGHDEDDRGAVCNLEGELFVTSK